MQPSTSHPVSRRQFVALGAAAALGAQAARRRVPVALQLYSVREECKKDLPKTLAAVAKMGYEGVEFYGWGGSLDYYSGTAKELRKILDELGLKAPSDHIQLRSVQGDLLARTVEFHQELGAKFLTIASWPGKKQEQTTAAFWEAAARTLNEVAAQLKPSGLRIGFHNHAVEFVPVEGRIPWDIMFEKAAPEIVMQLDLGSCLRGGADPLVYLKRYPGRAATMHLKDHSPDNDKALLGEGKVPWPQIFKLAESVGKIEWYIVEQESYPYPPLESAERCRANLRKLGR